MLDKDKPPFSRPSTRIGWSGISGVGFRIEHTSAAINCSVWSAVGVRGGVINKLRAICGRFLTPAIRNASELKTKQAVGKGMHNGDMGWYAGRMCACQMQTHFVATLQKWFTHVNHKLCPSSGATNADDDDAAASCCWWWWWQWWR